ncbi:O-antigen ligase family protein [Sorangium sp. So ce321]|uniref:O-antigen ligase family protein n=1 Tax=Sorangium sp. So ce321 TaxID=3133300 RepID=UPI003F6389E3
MAAWVVCALCALVIIKPQEFIPELSGIPLVHAAFGLTLLCVALDVVWRRLKPALAPQVVYALAFLAWAALTTALKRPTALEERGLQLATVAGIFLAVSVAAASPRGLRALAITLVGCAVLTTAVAIVQAFQPHGCMLAAPEDWEGKGELEPDGRPCETNLDCRKDPPVPDGNYRCERPGPLGTSTIDGRVRYRGSLADPNELSLMAGMSIPLAIALAERRAGPRRDGRPPRSPGRSDAGRPPTLPGGSDAGRSPRPPRRSGAGRPRPPDGGAGPPVAAPLAPGVAAARARPALPLLLTDRLLSRICAALRALPVAAVIVAIGAMVVMSRSRSGLIVYLAVLGLSFIRRSGALGVIAACFVGPPMLLLGGRSGDEATESSEERAALLREAFEMIRRTRGIGVGAGQFGDESSFGLTAHNAYMLAAAETGLLGMCLFALVLYASLKVPLAIWLGDVEVGPTARRFAPAIFVSLCGALIGIFFLSWAYKDVLYMVLGASAALYGAARAEDGRVSVRVSAREAALVCGGMFAVLVLLNVLLRFLG